MKIVEKLLKDIDYATEPSQMSKEEARDALQEIIDELRMRIEALDEEMK